MKQAISNDLFGYKGYVTYRRKSGDKVARPVTIKNSGTKHLFDGLTRALCGDVTALPVPTYVSLVAITSKPEGFTCLDSYESYSEQGYSQLTGLSRLTGAVWGAPATVALGVQTQNLGAASYNTVITYKDVIMYPESNVSTQLLLLSKDKKVLAYIDLTDNSLITNITSTSDLLLTWSLIIGNAV